MNTAWRSFFHHPDVSLPVVRRRAGEALLDLLLWYGKLVRSGGRSIHWTNTFPSNQAYYNALSRLRKAGLLVSPARKGEAPSLRLTPAGEQRTSDALNPERFWRKKWCGRWYVLVYDVPETRKVFRNGLRLFLARLRLGCLQRSVWVSPRDIRPAYDDLVKAAGVDSISFLFETSTVLGRDPQDIVQQAWDFERIDERHAWYRQVCEANLQTLRTQAMPVAALQNAAREEISAYAAVMEGDPLLPGELLPSLYRGKAVLELHKQFVSVVRMRLTES